MLKRTLKEKENFIKDYEDAKFNDEGSDIKDNYHSMSELYFNRMFLFSIICKQNKDKAWRSKLHHDGTMFENYFIVGIDTPEGAVSYHYSIKYWDYFNGVKEIPNSPEYKGFEKGELGKLECLVKEVINEK